MSPPPEEPTAAEWKVLLTVWESGPLAARDVVDALEAETGWSTSTVKTLLRRLVDKGHLDAEWERLVLDDLQGVSGLRALRGRILFV